MEILPETKVAALLSTYPQLEPILIDMAPAFKKLRNPVLRRTVAKMASLRQAAKVGNIDLEILVNHLRSNVGQTALILSERKMLEPDIETLKQCPVFQVFDARPILEAGEVPLEQIKSEISNLPKESVFILVTPFEPEPIKDLLSKSGYQSLSEIESPECVRTYFIRS